MKPNDHPPWKNENTPRARTRRLIDGPADRAGRAASRAINPPARPVLFIAGCCGRWALPIFRGNLVPLWMRSRRLRVLSTWKDGEWGESRVREPGRVPRNPRV